LRIGFKLNLHPSRSPPHPPTLPFLRERAVKELEDALIYQKYKKKSIWDDGSGWIGYNNFESLFKSTIL